MEYKDALDFTLNIGDTIMYENMAMKVVIAPKRQEDFQKFIGNYRTIKYDKTSSVPYSLDQQFRVCALWTDGVSVIHKGNLNEFLNN